MSRYLRCAWALLALMALSAGGCAVRDDVADSALADTGVPADAGREPLDAWRPRLDAGPPPDAYLAPARFRDGSVPEPLERAVVCGGRMCAAGQGCCLLTSACFDLSSPSECALPPGEHPEACASNADCRGGYVCQRHDYYVEDRDFRLAGACGGAVGRCVPIPAPSDCEGTELVCGCDGRTYESRCAAAQQGVRVSWSGACGAPRDTSRSMCTLEEGLCPGDRTCVSEWCIPNRPVVPCGLDSQCPEDWSCCAVAGVCVPDSCPECCSVPPSTTRVPCVIDAHCAGLDPDRPDNYFCDGMGCGTPGGCRRRPSCYPGDRHVCGCDGRTYITECYAAFAGTRVARLGDCE